MLRFVLFAVAAYILYQVVVQVNWDRAGNTATQQVEQGSEEAVDAIENSEVGRGVGEGIHEIRDAIGP